MALVAEEYFTTAPPLSLHLVKPVAARCSRHDVGLLFSESLPMNCQWCLEVDKKFIIPSMPHYNFAKNYRARENIMEKDRERFPEIDEDWKIPKFEVSTLIRGVQEDTSCQVLY